MNTKSQKMYTLKPNFVVAACQNAKEVANTAAAEGSGFTLRSNQMGGFLIPKA